MQEWAGFEESRIISRRSVDKRQTTVVSNDLAGGEQKRNSIVCVMQRLYLWWHKFFYIGRQYFESHARKRAKINPQNNFLRTFFFFFDAEKWSKTSTVIKNGTWWIFKKCNKNMKHFIKRHKEFHWFFTLYQWKF